VWALNGVRLVPYRLHELAEATQVFIAEGEKDCDRLAGLGLAATTNHGGAGKWREEHTAALVVAAVSEVVVLPDADQAGETHATAVAESCRAAGPQVKVVRLPGLPLKGDVSDWLASGHTAEELKALVASTPFLGPDTEVAFDHGPSEVELRQEGRPASGYIQPVAAFLAEEDPPVNAIFPELLPCGVIMLLHGEPRARKSLAAFELALAAATGTPAFGLTRFTPPDAVIVLYVQEEDPRILTRLRLRALVRARCGENCPDTLHVAVRRGIDLDDPVWVDRLIVHLKGLGAKLLVLDAARRLSAKTDEGPAKVRELTKVLRDIVTTAGVSIVIVHHDVKPPSNGQDQRRRGQRASGGDWFAACECPVHVEKTGPRESLMFPEDFKFSADPAPFTFICDIADGLITRIMGADTTSENAERAGVRGKVLEWLRIHGPASKTSMQKAGLARWEALTPVLEALCREGKIAAAPGRQTGSLRYLVPSPQSPAEDSTQ
jgi:hypothetical protein